MLKNMLFGLLIVIFIVVCITITVALVSWNIECTNYGENVNVRWIVNTLLIILDISVTSGLLASINYIFKK